MSRRIELAITPELRAPLVERLRDVAGVVGIAVQPGASILPPGDLLRVDATNEAGQEVLRVLVEARAVDRSVATLIEPSALVAPAQSELLKGQGNEAAWEEMSEQLRRDTNPSLNYLLLMAASGAIAAFGLVSDTLHIVIGAMLLAPGFEPLLRIALGLFGPQASPRGGVVAALTGYLALAAGAAAAAPVALLLEGREALDLGAQYWVSYWSSVKPGGIATSLIAAVAGAIIVSARLTVFATGVMVALALVPSMALLGVGLALGDLPLALGGLGRWAAEVGCVLLAGGAVLAAKRWLLHWRHLLG